MEKGNIGNIYHLSPDQGIAVKDVVKKICELTAVNYGDFVEIAEERLGQDKAYTIDSSKAKKEFGWGVNIDFDKGLKQTIDWIEEFYSIIKNQPLEYLHKK